MKPKKTAEELVQMLHDEKGIQFHLISEEQAVECFSQRNNYLRTASYRKNYPKHIAGPNAGKYIHLEFAYLAELSTLDFYLRELLLQMCIPGLKQSILSGQTKVSKTDMHRLAKAAYNDRAQTLQDILHPELKVEPTPDADGVIRVPGKAPVMPFRKFESVYDSDAYPEDVRYEYVALEELTTRFRISFNYQLEQMPDNAQRDVILEIIHKHKDYLASLEAALADVKDQTA